MIVKHELRDNTLFIMLIGELDHHTARYVREQSDKIIDSSDFKRVIFDMTYLAFMDSSGIGVLLGRYKKLAESKKPSYIMNPVPVVDRVLSMSGVYKLIKKL